MEQGAFWDGLADEAVPAVMLVAQQAGEPASDFAHRTCHRLAAVARQGVLVTSAVLAISSWPTEGNSNARVALATALLHRLSEDSGTELLLHAPETLAADQRAELLGLAGVLCEAGARGASIVVRFYARRAIDVVVESEPRSAIVLPAAANQTLYAER